VNAELHVVDDAIAEAGALIAEAVREGGAIALSGGHTAGAAFGAAVGFEPDWSRASIWFGDDRAVPPDDERSNYRLVRETVLDFVTPRSVHRIEGELGAEEAADRYDRLVGEIEIAFALNGIGPDAHTASLFPNAPSLHERERNVVAAPSALEPFVPRVTLTIPAFSRIDLIVYLVTGEDKAEAVRRAFGDAPSEEAPGSLVRGRRTIAVLDRAAAAQLSQTP
jgi:6-phosphogluconolactonase